LKKNILGGEKMTLKYEQLTSLVDAIRAAGHKTTITTAELDKLIMVRIGASQYIRYSVKDALKAGELMFHFDVNTWELPEEHARRQAAEEKALTDMITAEPEKPA
jgi:hypothetical protein